MRTTHALTYACTLISVVSYASAQSLTDISATVGIDNWQNNADVYPLDWNQDGCVDFLAHTSVFTNVELFINNCNGTFSRQNGFLNDFSGMVESICAGDVNNDGNIDLVVANDGVLTIYSIESMQCVGKTSLNDKYYGNIRLLDSDANGDLEIVVNSSGNGDETSILDCSVDFVLTSQVIYNSFSAELGVADVNNDGYSDIFVTRNDHSGPYGGYNIEYPVILVNNDGAFSVDSNPLPMVPHYPVTFFDYDNNMLFDAHIGSDDWIYNGPEKVWMLRNNGNFSFSDASQPGMYFGWNYYGHIEVVDIENDGDYDYFQQMGAWQGSRLIVNDGGSLGVFADFEFPGGDSGKGCGLMDYDADGDLDVLFSEHYWFHPLSHFAFYRNNSQGNYLTVTPVSSVSALNTYGIRIVAYVNGATIMPQMQESVYGFTRQFNIGLGSAAEVDSLVVSWPGGAKTSTGPVAANQFITVYQGDGQGTVGADDGPVAFALEEAKPNPFNPSTTISYSLAQTGPATLTVHNMAGQLVATLVDGLQERGAHEVSFDGSQLPSGLYVARLKTENGEVAQKLLLTK